MSGRDDIDDNGDESFSWRRQAVGAVLAVVVVAVGLALWAGDDTPPTEPVASPLPTTQVIDAPQEPLAPTLDAGRCVSPLEGQSVARVWNEQLLDAIRRDTPAPTVHARNLYHLSAAMWDAWAAFDPAATAVFHDAAVTADDMGAAREEAISHAAAVILTERYQRATGGPETVLALNETMFDVCGSLVRDAVASAPSGSAAALGVQIAETVLAATIDDGSNETADYTDESYEPVNPPLAVAFPGTEMTDPNRWQPLDLEVAFSQNDLPLPDGPQQFIGSQWGTVTGFALPPDGRAGVPLDPGPPPLLESDPAGFRSGVVEVLEASSQLATGVASIDIGPGARGNSTLGSDDGMGHARNPATGDPYEPNVVDRGDYLRAIAEFWADGPDSETPPGHWNTLANDVSDSLDAAGELRIEGTGDAVDRLEWDVKLYLLLNGALHDSAVAAWGAKAHYDYARPISMVRYLGGNGQSSDPELPSYDPDGLPLVPGLIELITEENSAPGQVHQRRANRVGEVFVRTWQGPPDDPAAETSGVDWIRSVLWVPYQQPTFVTPAFAAYVSGHSTFSRAGADVLAAFTGTPFFPGGMGEYTVAEGSLRHEVGPTTDVTLQWATYADAADEAGRSRIYGGIHVAADDLAGRVMGASCARLAWDRAQELF